MILIYLFEANPRWAKYVDQLFRWIERRNGEVILSVLGVTEIFTGVKKKGDKMLLRKYVAFFQNFVPLALIDVDFSIADRASDLRANYGIRTPDAIHLATAIEKGANLFVTNDKGLKKVKEITITTPDTIGEYLV